MKFAIVNFSDIGKCTTHRLDAQHWIDGHHTEECDPDKRAILARFTEEARKQQHAAEEELKRRTENEIETYRRRLRAETITKTSGASLKNSATEP